MRAFGKGTGEKSSRYKSFHRIREQATLVYYGAVLDAKKEIPARMTFGLSAEMDIVAEPGKMRITLRSNPRAHLIHIAVAVVAPILQSGLVLATLWDSLAALETIEIDDQKLVIRRENLGWTRTSEYDIDKCTDFRANERQSWMFSTALRCKAGERVINFGQDMSYDQVAHVISELKRNLPHAADQLLMRTDITTLNLSW